MVSSRKTRLCLRLSFFYSLPLFPSPFLPSSPSLVQMSRRQFESRQFSFPAGQELLASGVDPGVAMIASIVGPPTRLAMPRNQYSQAAGLFGISNQKIIWQDRWELWTGDNPALNQWMENSIMNNDNAIVNFHPIMTTVMLEQANGKYILDGKKVAWLIKRSQGVTMPVTASKGTAPTVRSVYIADCTTALPHMLAIELPIDFMDAGFEHAQSLWLDELAILAKSVGLTLVYEQLKSYVAIMWSNIYRATCCDVNGKPTLLDHDAYMAAKNVFNNGIFCMNKNGVKGYGVGAELESTVRRNRTEPFDIGFIAGPLSEGRTWIDPNNRGFYNNGKVDPVYPNINLEVASTSPPFTSPMYFSGFYDDQGQQIDPTQGTFYFRRRTVHFERASTTIDQTYNHWMRLERTVAIKDEKYKDWDLWTVFGACGVFDMGPIERRRPTANYPSKNGAKILRTILEFNSMDAARQAVDRAAPAGTISVGASRMSSVLQPRQVMPTGMDLSALNLMKCTGRLPDLLAQIKARGEACLRKLYDIYHTEIVGRRAEGMRLIPNALLESAIPYQRWDDLSVDAQAGPRSTRSFVLQANPDVHIPFNGDERKLLPGQQTPFANQEFEAFRRSILARNALERTGITTTSADIEKIRADQDKVGWSWFEAPTNDLAKTTLIKNSIAQAHEGGLRAADDFRGEGRLGGARVPSYFMRADRNAFIPLTDDERRLWPGQNNIFGNNPEFMQFRTRIQDRRNALAQSGASHTPTEEEKILADQNASGWSWFQGANDDEAKRTLIRNSLRRPRPNVSGGVAGVGEFQRDWINERGFPSPNVGGFGDGLGFQREWVIDRPFANPNEVQTEAKSAGLLTLLKYVPLTRDFFFEWMKPYQITVNIGIVGTQLLQMRGGAILGVIKGEDTAFHYIHKSRMFKKDNVDERSVVFTAEMISTTAIKDPLNVAGKPFAFCGGLTRGGGDKIFYPDMHSTAYKNGDGMFLADWMFMACHPDERPTAATTFLYQADPSIYDVKNSHEVMTLSTGPIYSEIWGFNKYPRGGHPFCLRGGQQPIVNDADQTNQWSLTANGTYDQSEFGQDVCGQAFVPASCKWFKGYNPIYGTQFNETGNALTMVAA